MLIQPFLIPVEELSNQNNMGIEGRSTLPDMMVVSITTTLGGSISQGGTNFLATDSHQISVNITNQGVSTGQSTLWIRYFSSPGATPIVINTGGTEIELDPFEFDTFTVSHSLSHVGVGQKYTATLTEATLGEDDLLNNYNIKFDGIDGGFYFNDNIIERNLDIVQISKGKTLKIN